MFDDEAKVFGPLTLRQFLYVALGFSFIYFPYTYLSQTFSIPLMVVGVFIFMKAFINVPNVIIDENYIKAKRYSFKNLEEFQRWLRRKIAECRSQIEIRKSQGMAPDQELEKKAVMFENALRDIK